MIRASAFVLIAEERLRQIQVEGFKASDDDGYIDGQLMDAGRCYYNWAYGRTSVIDKHEPVPFNWPWNTKWWKPVGPRQALIKAGALLLAEKDRVDRAAAKTHRIVPNYKVIFDLFEKITDELMKYPETPPAKKIVADYQLSTNIGSKVKKIGGYIFEGEIRAIFTRKNKEFRYVVENGEGILHIFNGKQLELV